MRKVGSLLPPEKVSSIRRTFEKCLMMPKRAIALSAESIKNIPGLYQKHLNKQLVNRSDTYESGSGQQLKKRLSDKR